MILSFKSIIQLSRCVYFWTILITSKLIFLVLKLNTLIKNAFVKTHLATVALPFFRLTVAPLFSQAHVKVLTIRLTRPRVRFVSQIFRPKRSIWTLRFKNNRLSLKWTVFSRTCLTFFGLQQKKKSNSLLENYFPKALVHLSLHLNIKQFIGSKLLAWLNHKLCSIMYQIEPFFYFYLWKNITFW